MCAVRPVDLCAALLALGGIGLAVEGRLAGSLFRYQLAAYVAGALLALPLLSIALWRDRARRAWRRVVFVGVPAGLLLLSTELAVRVFGPPAPPPAQLLEDEALGHALAPGSAGTDGRGFRNATTPDRVDLLCVGDSQTWGFHVDLADTFPARLGAELGATSYQMANGAWGVVQYRELVRRGLALRPQTVVVGFYFGNDLVDAVTYAGLAAAAELRAPDRTYAVPRNPELDGIASPNWTMALVDGLCGSSRVLGWSTAVVKSRLRGGVLDHQPGAVPFDDGRVSTILLPDYRLPTVDTSNDGVRDGLRITGRCLADIARLCREAGARCIVLAIPTKEFVYAEWLRARSSPLERLEPLRAAEATAREIVFAAVRDAGCELADLAAPAVAALGEARRPWPPSGDGHLNREGHALAATLLAESLRR